MNRYWKSLSKTRKITNAAVLVIFVVFIGGLLVWNQSSPTQYMIEKPAKLVKTSSLYTSSKHAQTQTYIPVDQQVLTTHYRDVKRDRNKPAVKITHGQTNSQTISASEYQKNLNGQTQSTWVTTEQLALKLAQVPYSSEPQGVIISEVAANQKTALKPGDRLSTMNGQPVTSAAQFNQAENSLKADKSVKITANRGSKKITADVKPLKSQNEKYHLGISAYDDVAISSSMDFDQTKELSKIGGTSYGLMLFTQMYFDSVGENQIRIPSSVKISGTGQIANDGRVMPVSGIEQKVYGAAKQGVTDFYVPNYPATAKLKKIDRNYVNNYTVAKQTVKKYHLSMKIHPVTSVYDIIDNLDQLGS